MNKKNSINNNISDVIAPMMAITMELDAIIGALLHEKFSMSLADFKVLRAIHILDVCTQLDIARFNHVTEAAVSRRIKSLLNVGLLKKRVGTEDKRESILSLTTKGKTLMKKLQIAVVENTESILSDFSKTNRASISKLLIEVLGMIIERSPNKDMLLKSKHPILGRLKKCQVNKK